MSAENAMVGVVGVFLPSLREREVREKHIERYGEKSHHLHQLCRGPE